MTCAFFNPFAGDWLHVGQSDRTITEASIAGGDVPEGLETSVTLLVGDTFEGAIGTVGDWDWFAVEATEGVSYTITMTPGTMDDPYFAIYDASGTLLQTVDVGFDGVTETITLTAPESGTYYIAATSYYNTPDGQAFGIADTGTYSLSIEAFDPADASPLDALNWNYTAPSNLNVYFAPGGLSFNDGFTNATTTGWSSFEQQQMELAFATFSAVANVTFNFVETAAAADFILLETGGIDPLGYWAVRGGFMTLDGTEYLLDGWGAFNSSDNGQGWSDAGIAQGGFGFVTMIHEIGHGMGLAHPHDDGGGTQIMPGVIDPFRDTGLEDLNQGIYTTMTYVDGWQTAPHGASPSENYGYQATPMAFDIAVLQEKYGANMSTNTGNDSYVLPTGNGAGTFYAAIWDAGGTDTLTHNGSAAAVLDLRAATLTYAPGGGGFVSYVVGIHGGFTIAANVMIENASGGAGNDTITGNAADNLIAGNDGHDIIAGGAGDDRLLGGLGNDSLDGGAGLDLLFGGTGDDSLDGGAGNDTLNGEAGADQIAGGDGNDQLSGWTGNDTLAGDGGDDRLFGGLGNDSLDGGAGNDRLFGGADGDVFIFADGHGRDTISDFDAIDTLEQIDLSGITALAGFADYTAFAASGAVTASGGGVLIDTGGGNSILLAGVSLANLDNTDFIF
ncbi:pre-peptidase C-terminal domain-containing protein [Roseicyclus sp.]|uniref:pre-peptidase C-terminal domain-containing protein n=1 Tax=Roseicyclus sp. TaxID=1914329 RepID=UPI003F69E5F5